MGSSNSPARSASTASDEMNAIFDPVEAGAFRDLVRQRLDRMTPPFGRHVHPGKRHLSSTTSWPEGNRIMVAKADYYAFRRLSHEASDSVMLGVGSVLISLRGNAAGSRTFRQRSIKEQTMVCPKGIRHTNSGIPARCTHGRYDIQFSSNQFRERANP